MSDLLSYDEISHLLGSSENLPEVPSGPLRLSSYLEAGESDTREIEKIILSDPALTAGVLRAASSSLFGRQRPVTTAREAIMVMGLRTLRSISMAMYTHALVCQSRHQSHFDPERFARNGNSVGSIANVIFRESFGLTPNYRWNADELYVGGVLHNVMFGLLSYAAPQEFNRLFELGKEEGCDLRTAFKAIHEHSLAELAPRAVKAMCLPEMFDSMIQGIESPSSYPAEESVPYCVLRLSMLLADESGNGLTPWSNVSEEIGELAASLGLSLDRVEELAEIGQMRATEFARAA
ncbi:HDOD domain-containing protein [Kamptonema cortianum]|nr:HDOD domain-containing protein [Geitlerinema splendidum]MDK3155325.1 HDOD domain-containing protein [Kamptonema cortianum]